MSLRAQAIPLATRMSPVGIGTARGVEDTSTDVQMTDILLDALRAGVSVIDTAVNYRRGRSEQCAGAALRKAIEAGIVDRSDVVVSSKAGYPRPDGGVSTSHSPPEHHAPGEHCLAPACIRHSLLSSLETLDVGKIDLYYLHNIEAAGGIDDRLLPTIEILERAVSEGHIGGYGFSTWSLENIDPLVFAALADRVAGTGHHFIAVQAPLSLSMRSALDLRYSFDGERVSLLTLCKRLGILFVASAAAGGASVPSLAAASVRTTVGIPGVTTALVGTLCKDHLLAALGGWSKVGSQ